LQQIPSFGNFVQVVPLQDHIVVNFFIQENDLLQFDGQVIFIRQRVGQHDAWADADWRNDNVLNNKIVDGSCAPDIDEDQLVLWNVNDNFFGLPGVQLIYKLVVC
jgi:hypothetical protein